jgi:CheY-like chemotaxis protein
MKILVLEDNQERIDKFRHELRGHKVFVATNAEIGIGLATIQKYDLIFLDHDLGSEDSDNNGYRVAQAIANEKLQNGAIIILHSCNPCGTNRMKNVLPEALVIPYTLLNIQAVVGLRRKNK